MSKTAICFYSEHHGNTKKLLDALCAAHSDIALIDVTDRHEVDLSMYDIIGFASGIYFGKFAEPLLNFARVNLPPQKEVFYIASCGSKRNGYFKAISDVAKNKQCIEKGEYLSLGFDTYGPFKMVGGIAKGHPDDSEIQGVIDFYEGNII